MIGTRLIPNGSIYSCDTPVDIQLVVFNCFPMLVKETLGAKTNKSWWRLSPVKYILSSKNLYPFVAITLTYSDRSFSFFPASTCFVLFELTFLLIYIGFLSKSVFFTKSGISSLPRNSAFTNLSPNIVPEHLLKSLIVIYSLWIFFIFYVAVTFVN